MCCKNQSNISSKQIKIKRKQYTLVNFFCQVIFFGEMVSTPDFEPDNLIIWVQILVEPLIEMISSGIALKNNWLTTLFRCEYESIFPA